MPAFTPEMHQYFGLETLGSFVRSHEIVEVDGILVDVDALFRHRYTCDCSSCLQEGRHGEPVGDCCHGAEIRISDGERQGILAHLPGILPYMEPAPRQAVEARLAKVGSRRSSADYQPDPTLAFSRPRSVHGRRTDLTILRWQPDTNCLFRYIKRDGARPYAFCAIHSYLLERGLPVWGTKPLTCLLWPLALVPLCDGHLLVTLHTLESYMFTGEGRFHASRPCLASPPPDAPPVYRACEPDLRQMFGNAFYEHMLAAVEGGAGRWTPAWGRPEQWPGRQR